MKIFLLGGKKTKSGQQKRGQRKYYSTNLWRVWNEEAEDGRLMRVIGLGGGRWEQKGWGRFVFYTQQAFSPFFFSPFWREKFCVGLGEKCLSST